MERNDKCMGLLNFAKNTRVVTEELYNMLQTSKLEKTIGDANWRFGDMSIMCDEIAEQCSELMKIV